MRSRTGIWLAATSKAPIGATTLIVPKAGRPNSWDEIAVVRAPARAPPTTVAGIQAQAPWPPEVRSTQACAPPATAPPAASASAPATIATFSLTGPVAPGVTQKPSTLGITTSASTRLAATEAGTHQ